jgi:hypothetical protein
MTGGDDHVYNGWTKTLTNLLSSKGYFRVRLQLFMPIVNIANEGGSNSKGSSNIGKSSINLAMVQ